MKLILFGNRGSRPLGASDDSPFRHYGGDTTSMAVTFDDGTLVALDAGTGFWKWPYTLSKVMDQDGPYDLHLFFSHYHDDHTMGIAQSPFLFSPGNVMTFYGPRISGGLENFVLELSSKPGNPDLAYHYQADLQFENLADQMQHPVTLANSAEVSWLSLPHGDESAMGYRIDYNGQSLCVLSDTHHDFDPVTDEPILNEDVIAFIRDADVLVYDSHFSDKELNETRYLRSFGHSTGEHGVRLAEKAGIPVFITHHHNPMKTDHDLDQQIAALQTYAKPRNVSVFAAKPSLCLDMDLSVSDLVQSLNAQDLDKDKRFDAIKGDHDYLKNTAGQENQLSRPFADAGHNRDTSQPNTAPPDDPSSQDRGPRPPKPN